jgi:hypothetical protein
MQIFSDILEHIDFHPSRRKARKGTPTVKWLLSYPLIKNSMEV